MRTPLAWYNLRQERLRTLVATAGVAFALTLIFMQLGFLGSVVTTATLVLEQLDFDVAIVAQGYQHLGEAGSFSRLRLDDAASVRGVVRATPFYVGLQAWRSEWDRSPDGQSHRGKHRPILVLAFPDDAQPFRLRPDHWPRPPLPIRASEADLALLRQADTLLIDAQSHASFEPRQPGRFAEVGGRRMRIAGQFNLGTGFASDGTVLVGEKTFARLMGGYPAGRVSLGLLKLSPDWRARRDEVATTIRRALLADRPPSEGSPSRQEVRILTRDELLGGEISYWLWKKSIGLIFVFGVVVALIIGVVVVYQVLSSDIMDHFREYATLKAMGYSNRYLRRVVLFQAWFLSLFGYAPALIVAHGLYDYTRARVNLPMLLTPAIAVGVLILSALMCSIAALLTVRKVASSDPASLF